jgi:predicted O-linked N-acetylglucosamine transferase (SPINDLY family)
LALHQAGRLAEAKRLYETILTAEPRHFDSLHLLGVILHQQGDQAEALERIDAALAINAANAFAYNNRAVVLHALQRFAEAVESCDKAIALKPDYAEAHYNRGNALRRLNRHVEAAACYDRAIALRPDYADAFCNRGIVLKQLVRFEEARASFERALALKPDLAEAQFGLCMAELPILYESEAEILVRRAGYEQRLRALCAAAERSPALAKGVGASQPFFLAYQGRNDRDLQARYGSLVCRMIASRYPATALAPLPRDTERIRIGIVSGFFRQHTVWKLMIKGWLSQLDRRRFQVFGYHTGEHCDVDTERAAAMCDRLVLGLRTVEDWRAAILADAPHALLYPELGMDPTAAALAAQRLAAVQCNSWGHPETSGFPTLDYFLSSELMEPADAEDHYTERLIRLPNLSIHYEPIEDAPVAVTRRDLGLRPRAIAFWCGQSLYKYLPQFDEVFARIALSVGDCQFAFIRYDGGDAVTDLFRRRLDRAFAACGLKAGDHCLFLPRLEQGAFIAATGQCDVFLDSIHWSGGNTTLESLAHALPIVTLPGPLMRGRHSAAILRMMGVTETIAETVDDYVALAVRLAQDTQWRQAIRAKMSANRHRVYRDRECIAKLEDFLSRAVLGGPGRDQPKAV